jgi:hypothetical protein
MSGRCHTFGRVGLFEQLFRNLAKVVDEADSGVFLQWVVNAERMCFV